jgi:hypothetical protein
MAVTTLDESTDDGSDEPDTDDLAIDEGIISKGIGDSYQYTQTLTYDKTKSGKKKVTTGLKYQLVETCARGETKTYSASRTVKWSGSLSGECFASFSLGVTASYTFTTTFVFTGPDRDSPKNCTRYIVRYDGNTGTFTQLKKLYHDGVYKKIVGTKHGTFKKPTLAFEYSEDVVI